MSEPIVLVGRVGELTSEDDGCALYADNLESMESDGADPGFFVRLHSWSEADGAHETLLSLQGKLISVTITVLEDE